MAYFSPGVSRVSREKQPAEPGLEGEGNKPQGNLADENQQEPALIPAQSLPIDVDGHVGRLTSREKQHDADNGVSNGGQDKRATQGRANTNVLRFRAGPEHDSDEGNDTLRKGSAKSRQHRADRVLGNAGLVA